MNLAHLECTFAEVPNAAKAIMLPAYRSMLKPTRLMHLVLIGSGPLNGGAQPPVITMDRLADSI
jgi:hypothetical protein